MMVYMHKDKLVIPNKQKKAWLHLLGECVTENFGYGSYRLARHADEYPISRIEARGAEGIANNKVRLLQFLIPNLEVSDIWSNIWVRVVGVTTDKDLKVSWDVWEYYTVPNV
jgi:hypothetical protein